jgi:hypothetical protein
MSARASRYLGWIAGALDKGEEKKKGRKIIRRGRATLGFGNLNVRPLVLDPI